MKIDFNAMERTKVEHQKGGEGHILTKFMDDPAVKIIDSVVVPGASVGYHCHETGWEVMFFVEGRFLVNYDGTETVYEAGQAHYCPNGHSHSVKNCGDTDARFYAVVAK